jgi:hypothetical protein
VRGMELKKRQALGVCSRGNREGPVASKFCGAPHGALVKEHFIGRVLPRGARSGREGLACKRQDMGVNTMFGSL